MTTIGFNPLYGRAQPKRIAANRPIKAEFIRLEGETAHLVRFLATRGDSESKSEYVFPSKQTGKPHNDRQAAQREARCQAVSEDSEMSGLRSVQAVRLAALLREPSPGSADQAGGRGRGDGHKSVTTTLAFYARAIPRDMGYIAEKLEVARRRR